jgi:hypothetical protein
MVAAGVNPDISVQADYFGFSEVYTVTLPDGVSWVQHRSFNEGDRRQYLNKANREVTVERVSGDAKMKVASGDERYNLLLTAIKGWSLVTAHKTTGELQPIEFNETNLRKFLDSSNPKIIDIIEKDVREHNPWLMAEITVEGIDEQIAELQKLRERKVAEAEGKAS